MSDKMKSILWFGFSFGLSFGSYLFVYTQQDWRRGYGPMYAFATAVIYLVICGLATLSTRRTNRPLAGGFAWGMAGILIFLFTISGCFFSVNP
jgi:FtsH-binding integral membrane protein